jgi:hypothetical protein
VKLVDGVSCKGSSLGEGDYGAAFLGALADLPKGYGAASSVFTVDEDRIAMLRQATEQRPIRDVVPAYENGLKEREHHSNVERALMVGDDQCAAFVDVLPVHQELCAEDTQKTVAQTCAVSVGELRLPGFVGHRASGLVRREDTRRETRKGPGTQNRPDFAHFRAPRLWTREGLDLVAVSARGGITRTGIPRRSTFDAVPVFQSYAGVADRSR